MVQGKGIQNNDQNQPPTIFNHHVPTINGVAGSINSSTNMPSSNHNYHGASNNFPFARLPKSNDQVGHSGAKFCKAYDPSKSRVTEWQCEFRKADCPHCVDQCISCLGWCRVSSRRFRPLARKWQFATRSNADRTVEATTDLVSAVAPPTNKQAVQGSSFQWGH